MPKFVTASLAVLVAAFALVGFAASASARHAYPGCHCGPYAPTYAYRTIHPVSFSTRYHDVSVTRRVTRIHRIVHVTRVQPIIRIHDVTRIHHRTIVETRNAIEHVTQQLTPIRYVERSVVNTYSCGCAP